MSTKDTIRSQEKAGNLPGWQSYSEMFEKDDFVCLEFEGGVQVDVNMIGSLWGHPPGTVVLRLPTATARQLGVVPYEWTGDASCDVLAHWITPPMPGQNTRDWNGVL